MAKLRFRFSLLTCMFIVGASALLLSVQLRAAYCRQRAVHYKLLVGCGTHFGIPALDELTDRHQRMQRTYERIEWRPWEPLPTEAKAEPLKHEPANRSLQ